MKKGLKWTLRILGGLIGMLVVAGITVYAMSEMRMTKHYDVKAETITLKSDSATLSRGKHVVRVLSKCVDCHAQDLGGGIVIDDPMIGYVAAPNLTQGKGSATRNYHDSDWVRAIRHGLQHDGSPLLVMPASEYYPLSDDDLGAIISYIKSMPPVDRTMAKSSASLLTRALLVTGQLEFLSAEAIPHEANHPDPPPPAMNADYGKHLLETGCIGCHGPNFSGGKIPGTPPDWPQARNLTPDATTGLGKWTEDDFFRALRTGIRPNGDSIRAPMPWQATAQMTDDEIRSIWMHLKRLPAKKQGNR